MNVKDLIRSGRLTQARKLLVEDVRTSPCNAASRAHLFQVLLFMGEWDKALNHLELLAGQGDSADPGFQVYKDMIAAQKKREDVYRLQQRPDFWPEPPSYGAHYVKALEMLSTGDFDVASELFKTIDAMKPVQPCVINGQAKAGFINTDSVLSHVIEAFEFDRYYWIPISSIRELRIEPPRTLFDLLWAKAHVTTWTNLTTTCFLPVLYPDSPYHEDDQVRMGKVTQWQTMGPMLARGLGQQVFQAGDEDISLLEVTTVEFGNAVSFQEAEHV